MMISPCWLFAEFPELKIARKEEGASDGSQRPLCGTPLNSGNQELAKKWIDGEAENN